MHACKTFLFFFFLGRLTGMVTLENILFIRSLPGKEADGIRAFLRMGAYRAGLSKGPEGWGRDWQDCVAGIGALGWHRFVCFLWRRLTGSRRMNGRCVVPPHSHPQPQVQVTLKQRSTSSWFKPPSCHSCKTPSAHWSSSAP